MLSERAKDIRGVVIVFVLAWTLPDFIAAVSRPKNCQRFMEVAKEDPRFLLAIPGIYIGCVVRGY